MGFKRMIALICISLFLLAIPFNTTDAHHANVHSYFDHQLKRWTANYTGTVSDLRFQFIDQMYDGAPEGDVITHKLWMNGEWDVTELVANIGLDLTKVEEFPRTMRYSSVYQRPRLAYDLNSETGELWAQILWTGSTSLSANEWGYVEIDWVSKSDNAFAFQWTNVSNSYYTGWYGQWSPEMNSINPFMARHTRGYTDLPDSQYYLDAIYINHPSLQ